MAARHAAPPWRAAVNVAAMGSVRSMAGIAVGERAPDFTLPGIQGTTRRDYSLAEHRGEIVVLAFYPGDFTPG